jgi:hypothetical protein
MLNWMRSRVFGLFVNVGMVAMCGIFLFAQPVHHYHKPPQQKQDNERDKTELERQEEHIEYLDKNLQDLKLDVNTYATQGKTVAAVIIFLNGLGVFRKWIAEEKNEKPHSV